MIRWAFTNPDSPACFAGVTKVLAEVRKIFPKTKLGEVKDVLQRINAYTLHRPRRFRFRRLKTIPNGFASHIQVDLADMQKVASDNDEFKYILVNLLVSTVLEFLGWRRCSIPKIVCNSCENQGFRTHANCF